MKLSRLAKRMMAVIAVWLVVFLAAAAFLLPRFDRPWLPFLWGALLGTAVSLVKVWLLERAVTRALDMPAKDAGNYVRFQHLLRLGLTGGALLVAVLGSFMDLWGAAAGVISFQLSLYVVKFSGKTN
ncbi:MAG: ATP synthase subunit I [Eubacteriales bacterium]